MSSAPPAEPVQLAYAGDLPSQYGIVYEVVGRLARIAVPNSSRLLYRVVALALPLILLFYGGVYAAQALNLAAIGKAAGALGAVVPVAMNVAIAALLIAGAYGGFRDWLLHPLRRVVLELDEDRFTVHDQDANDRPRTRWWWRRSIGSITVGPVPWNAGPGGGVGLHVRIVGKTILEIMGGHEPAVADWVAARLNEALSAPAPTLADSPS